MVRIVVSSTLLFPLSLLLTGCQYIDTYYTFDPDFLSKIEAKYDSLTPEEKVFAEKLYRSAEVRIKLEGTKTKTLKHHTLIVDGTEGAALPSVSNTPAQVGEVSNCKYFDAKNWVCEDGIHRTTYEMRENTFFVDGVRMTKHYRLAL